METNITELVGQPEGKRLEYKAVLPPARTLSQLIAAFANADGGHIILGVRDDNGKISVTGLSEDFHATTIFSKALDLLSPIPNTQSQYLIHQGKRLFVIAVAKSGTIVLVEGKHYTREASHNILVNPVASNFNTGTLPQITDLTTYLTTHQQQCTGALSKFIDHYKSVLNIFADMRSIVYPTSSSIKTTNNEGKILMRILFSSCADNVETYLSDLLYEIYLANPDSLKSGQQVTIKEVLDCNDIQEFINYYAKKKLSKLQRGSVKGFIAENQQINSLNAITALQQEELEKILQIRHLYAHKNGVVDEKFLTHFPEGFVINESHEMSLDSCLHYLKFISETMFSIDKAALRVHSLATL